MNTTKQLIEMLLEAGRTCEGIAANLGWSVNRVEAILVEERVRRKEFKTLQHVQVKCPNCKQGVLSGFYQWLLDKEGNVRDAKAKSSYSFCIHCQAPLHFVATPNDDQVIVKLVESVNFYMASDRLEHGHGVALSTDLYVSRRNGQWVIRAGIAILGNVNFKEMIDSCPFDPYFRDNYCEGIGGTRPEALEHFLKELEGLKKGL